MCVEVFRSFAQKGGKFFKRNVVFVVFGVVDEFMKEDFPFFGEGERFFEGVLVEVLDT